MTNPTHPERPVLIVEDNPKNVQVLGTILMEGGYQVAVAAFGPAALELVPKIKPGLILLDIMMAEMDGYEVCQRLKADPATREIPVIFLTAKTETDDIIRGFELGGADYITKPFRARELLARVETHLSLWRLQQELQRKNAELTEALANIKTLSGLLPICACCKKIRNDTGYWEQVEEYIGHRTTAQFTHGLCPECAPKYFPDAE